MSKSSNKIKEVVIRSFRIPPVLWRKFQKLADNNRRTASTELLICMEKAVESNSADQK